MRLVYLLPVTDEGKSDEGIMQDILRQMRAACLPVYARQQIGIRPSQIKSQPKHCYPL
jgi:hypothetical protein